VSYSSSQPIEQINKAALAFSPWRFCVAPMIDVTDRHCRFFLRLLSRHARLYTEMITCPAILHGNQDFLLGFDAQEHPLALQLGGSKPEEYARCAAIAENYGYDEININVGCPSDRVQSGSFGACLMKQPELVADCVRAIQENSKAPCTIKTRIGVDNLDSFEFLENFIRLCHEAGCNTFIIHARIAILKGLSPKENRSIPPLNYQRVEKIKALYPQLNIILNGGLQSYELCDMQLKTFDGVMLGREIYKNPWLLTEVDKHFFNETHVRNDLLTRSDIVEQFMPYMKQQIKQGQRIHNMSRHLVGLYHGQKFGKHWRQFTSSNQLNSENDLEKLVTLAKHIDSEISQHSLISLAN